MTKFLIRTRFATRPKSWWLRFRTQNGDPKVSYGNSDNATTGGLALTYKTKHYDFNGDFICDTQFYMIYMNWLNHVLCDYVTGSLWSPYVLVAMCMCMQFYDFLWYTILSSWNMIVFYNTYMHKYIMCSLNQLSTCG